MKRLKLSELIFGLAILGIIVAGVGLRWHAGRTPFISSNVDTFYFHRSAILDETGKFPHEDKWGFAPGVWQENTPPLLGYLTWAGFSLWKSVGQENNLSAFANFFPVFVYVLWVGIAAPLIWRFYLSRELVLLVSALITFTPVAIEVTGYGRYFEENIGVPLLFLSAIFFINLARRDRTLWWGIAALTGLVLSWQAFPFFYVAALVVIALGWILGDRDRSALSLRILMLLVPLFLAEILVRIFVGNNYSAFGMLKEFWLAFLNRNDPALLNAMYRKDWANSSLEDFGKYYGLAGVFLLSVGVVSALLRLRDQASSAALVFGVTGIFLVAEFTKFRHLAFSFFGPAWILGMQALTNPEPYLSVAARFINYIFQWLRSHWRKVLQGVGIAVALGLLLIAFWNLWAWRVPLPVAKVSIMAKEANADFRKVEIKMTNVGGRTSALKKAFAGFHIAVENGEILHTSPFSTGIGEPNLGTKLFSHWGNVNFFEVSYPRLLEGDSAGVLLDIKKTAQKPIVIYWRAWLPKYYCSLWDRREGIKDLRAGWRNLAHGWRNEKCIVRIPANDDTKEDFCPTKVFAAHKELQSFRCAKVEIQ
jgi:hypothetical protein